MGLFKKKRNPMDYAIYGDQFYKIYTEYTFLVGQAMKKHGLDLEQMNTMVCWHKITLATRYICEYGVLCTKGYTQEEMNRKFDMINASYSIGYKNFLDSKVVDEIGKNIYNTLKYEDFVALWDDTIKEEPNMMNAILISSGMVDTLIECDINSLDELDKSVPPEKLKYAESFTSELINVYDNQGIREKVNKWVKEADYDPKLMK